MIRWLIRLLGLNRRYGVRFDSDAKGSKEQTGFKTRRHATNWARDNCRHCKRAEERVRKNCVHFVVFDYEPALDMRLPGLSHSERPSFRP